MSFPSGSSMMPRVAGMMIVPPGPPTGLYEIYGVRASGDPKYLILELIPYHPQVADTAFEAHKDRMRQMKGKMEPMLKSMPKETAEWMREFLGTFGDIPPPSYMPPSPQGPPIAIPIEKKELESTKFLEIGNKVTITFNAWEEPKEPHPDKSVPT